MLDDELLLSRVEDASLNASAPPQQLWLDGWIVRSSPAKARRARCINAVAAGRLPLAQKLALAAAVYSEAGLPMLVRVTRFTQPAQLDAQLQTLGWGRVGDTWVMVGEPLARTPPPLPASTVWRQLGAADYAEAVGALRGSPLEQRQAHAQRLAASPVPYRGFVLCSVEDGSVLACGQFAREAELVGLYDVFTHESVQGRGLATLLCERLLSIAASEGARVVYLQVEADNHAARRVYQRLGFADAYSYHYMQPPAGA